jgi:hypothetical protein
VLLAVGHFAAPFIIMLVRAVKRSPLALSLFAVWMLLMHYIDMYWLVMPTLHTENAVFSWLDAVTMIGIGGIFLWLFFWKLSRHSLVPINDPNLDNSINHRS